MESYIETFHRNADNWAIKKQRQPMSEQTRKNSRLHMPPGSAFFEKIVPALLIVMGVITVGLILFAAGVLLGIVQF